MWWRRTRADYEAQKGAGNRRALRDLVARGAVPGLLGYDDGKAVAWCALAPREAYPRLERSRILKPVDDQRVWSIVCFFVSRSHRQRGVSGEMLRAAVEWVGRQGGSILEGYPVEPESGRVAPLFAYTGLARTFRSAGFVECARRSPTRPIMRLPVSPPST